MISEETSKFPISKAFWVLMVLSFIAFLIGTSPDDTAKYKDGLNELKEVQKLSRRADVTYKFVASDVAKQLGENPIEVISKVIEVSSKKPISGNVLPNIEYFWIDQGPLGLPDKINDLYERFQKDINYTVRAPSITQLKIGMSEALKGVPEKFG